MAGYAWWLWKISGGSRALLLMLRKVLIHRMTAQKSDYYGKPSPTILFDIKKRSNPVDLKYSHLPDKGLTGPPRGLFTRLCGVAVTFFFLVYIRGLLRPTELFRSVRGPNQDLIPNGPPLCELRPLIESRWGPFGDSGALRPPYGWAPVT